jgi:hypothetical protein
MNKAIKRNINDFIDDLDTVDEVIPNYEDED